MPRGWMYILLCNNGSYYVGSTNDINKRLMEHENGVACNYTMKNRPVKLVYFEEYPSIDLAFLREQQVKKWSKAKKEALINQDYELLKRLSKNK